MPDLNRCRILFKDQVSLFDSQKIFYINFTLYVRGEGDLSYIYNAGSHITIGQDFISFFQLSGGNQYIEEKEIVIYRAGEGFIEIDGSYGQKACGIFLGGGFDSENAELLTWLENNSVGEIKKESVVKGTKWQFNSALNTFPEGIISAGIYNNSFEDSRKFALLDESMTNVIKQINDMYAFAAGPDTLYWYLINTDRTEEQFYDGSYVTRYYGLEIKELSEYYPFEENMVLMLNANAARIDPDPPSPPKPPQPQDPLPFMPHSITFFDYDGTTTVYRNTFDHWHMVPEERPISKMPTQKTKYLEVPGSDGILDLSELITGRPLYNNREGEFSFYILNGYDTFENIKSKVANYLHGRKKYAVLIDDPDYLYEGRFEVNFENDDSLNHSKCTISYNLKPYKIKFSSSITSSGWEVDNIFPEERSL